jgi:hypothetical protein
LCSEADPTRTLKWNSGDSVNAFVARSIAHGTIVLGRKVHDTSMPNSPSANVSDTLLKSAKPDSISFGNIISVL